MLEDEQKIGVGVFVRYYIIIFYMPLLPNFSSYNNVPRKGAKIDEKSVKIRKASTTTGIEGWWH